MARRFGQITVFNAIVATVAACVVWAVSGNWALIPLFLVLGAVVFALGVAVVRRAG